MNPAALGIVERMMGEGPLRPDLRRAPRRLALVTAAIALPILGATLLTPEEAAPVRPLSGAMETVSAGRTLLHGAHAGGVASGLLIGGVQVPDGLIGRIEEIVDRDLVSGARALTEARLAGLEAALAGGWTTERLEAYVSRIESSDPDLGRIINEETGRLAEAGLPEEQARLFLRAVTVRLMAGGVAEAPLPAGTEGAPEAARISLLERAQGRIRSHLEETSRLGGLDPAITRDVAIALLAAQMAGLSAADGPSP